MTAPQYDTDTTEKFIVEAHYPRLVDFKEETFATRDEALAAKDRHCAAGANVQIRHVFWRLLAHDDGWFSAATQNARRMAGGE